MLIYGSEYHFKHSHVWMEEKGFLFSWYIKTEDQIGQMVKMFEFLVVLNTSLAFKKHKILSIKESNKRRVRTL